MGWQWQREVMRDFAGDCWRLAVKDSVNLRNMTYAEFRRLPLGVLARLRKRKD